MIKKWILFALSLVILESCQQSSPEAVLEGKIIGFRKGTLLLNRVEKDSLVPIDSLKIKTADGHFRFDLSGVEPQLLAITIKERPGEYLIFFSDDTTMQLQTKLENFGVDKYLSGGENTRLWKEYQKILSQYNDQKLDLIKKRLDPNLPKSDSLKKVWEKEAFGLEKRRKLYALNFAINHKDKPVAAYAAFIEFGDNPKALDTIYKSLTQEVKNSYYGRKLTEIISKPTY